MSPTREQHSSRPSPARQLAELRARLDEAEAALRAIHSGEVDAVVVAGAQGPQVFTLQGAEHAYRVLIESMNEGALTLAADATVLYANQCFATMVKCPLAQVLGGSFQRFLPGKDRVVLRRLLRRAGTPAAKVQVLLTASDGTQLPAQISFRPLPTDPGSRATIGLVVTDMSEARRTEGMLRALTRRVVQVQEAERTRLALELHDSITQLLCAALFRSQVLRDRLPAGDGPLQQEALRLHEILGKASQELERVSRQLRPSVLAQLGLVPLLRSTSAEFAERTGLTVELSGVSLTARLPVDIELTLYRVLQEALLNVEKHARARHVSVCLRQQGACVRFEVHDDGTGFDPDRLPARSEEDEGLGLLGMHERVTYVGGTLKIKSSGRAGTDIQVRIPLPSGAETPTSR